MGSSKLYQKHWGADRALNTLGDQRSAYNSTRDGDKLKEEMGSFPIVYPPEYATR